MCNLSLGWFQAKALCQSFQLSSTLKETEKSSKLEWQKESVPTFLLLVNFQLNKKIYYSVEWRGLVAAWRHLLPLIEPCIGLTAWQNWFTAVQCYQRMKELDVLKGRELNIFLLGGGRSQSQISPKVKMLKMESILNKICLQFLPYGKGLPFFSV